MPRVSAECHPRAVDDRGIGTALRTLRQRRGWRQVDLARRTGLSIERIAAVETGQLEKAGLTAVRTVAASLDAALDLRLRWRGEALDRLLNAAHSHLHVAFGRLMTALPAWRVTPEVSFSVYGERGVIDVLLWHRARRLLVVVELKTSIVDVQELLGTLDRKRRLAPRIARERGWDPLAVSVWLVVAESRTNRRRVAAHASLLRAALPADGRSMRAWLREGTGAVAVLSFLPIPAPGRASVRSEGKSATSPGARRVRVRRAVYGSGVGTMSDAVGLATYRA